MTKPIEDAYLERCRNIATEIKQVLGARRTLLLSMIGEHGAVETTMRLVHAKQPSDTFVDLMAKGRLDLTVEWLIVNERKWDSLFTDETRTAARNRLGTSSSSP